MTRILADLPDEDINWLDAIATESGRSRAALLRDAVSAFRAENTDWIERGCGLWTRHGGGQDGDDFEEAARPGWSTLSDQDASEA
ncbi:MAG TPA: CopG family transcriptional regulator [Croceibacterium sp.]|nr:CopG family transcriptional regulator [Croceibacterium sp.]